MGGMEDEIVSPHASVLAINLFPREVIDNLRRLETYGLRKPFVVDGKPEPFGFRDSVNWATGDIAAGYLVLDQAMLFLSLVNFCEDGLLWKTFGADPMVRHGKESIKDYAEAAAHRAEEESYIAALSFDEPGVTWLPQEWPCRTARPGQKIRRDLWAKSLSAKPLTGLTQTCAVLDSENGRRLQCDFGIQLAPHETRRVGAIIVTTDQAARGKEWTLFGALKSKEGELQSHREAIFFPSYLPLDGPWKLIAGDDPAWSNPELDETGWLTMDVPGRWENTVLPDYDGLAWYRHAFEIPGASAQEWADKPLAIAIGGIDDADETFLNGVKIGSAGAFPPEQETAFNEARLYTFDKSLLKATNVIAVRVSDWGGFGGIWRGPVMVGPAEELEKVMGALE
ncbi:MAG TPA: glucoamylase family protein [Kiritimatiellia bacterium]